MTDTTTEAVERLMNGVTPGPWIHDGNPRHRENVYSDDATGSIVATCGGFTYAPRLEAEKEANAAFIAAARELVPALLADRDRLAALLAANQSPDPVTNADSCQPMYTYADGVRDALAMAISTIEDQFPGALYASNRTKCIALIKEKSHE